MILLAKDIKTRKVISGTIKTLHGTIKVADRSIRTGGAVENIVTSALQAESPDNAPANALQTAEMHGTQYAAHKSASTTVHSAHRAIHVKKNMQRAKDTIKQVKPTIKAVGKTATSGTKSVQASVKTAKNMVKTANTAVKTSASAARATASTAKAGIQGAKLVVKTSVQAVKITLKAAIEAFKITAKALVEAGEAIAGAIAAGGWIVIAILLIVLLLAILLSSAAGIFFSDSSSSGSSISVARQELNAEFAQSLEAQRMQLQGQGYSHIVVRPAPTITQWNDIIAVYSVRAQKQNLPPLEITEQTKAILRETLWSMVSFSTSSETIVSTETDESGNPVTVTEVYGIVTVCYKTPQETADLYSFSADDREWLTQVLNMYTDLGGIQIGSGNGRMINPCPTGHINGNDYPAYAGSGEYHAGRDIACPIGTPIYAAADGTVIHVNDQAETYGNHIMIDHGGEIYTLYAHCDTILVSVGQTVKQGDQIALSGATGNVTGPHLHFEVRVGGSRFRVNNVDPLEWIA